MAATRAQLRMFTMTKKICLSLGIAQSTLDHKHLKGSFSTPSATGNRIYKNPPAMTKFDSEIQVASKVWFIWQPFIRGEERPVDYAPAVIPTPMQEGQLPALDDSLNPILLAEDDFLITPDGVIWKVRTPTPSPDMSYWTFMFEQHR
jgi:hypothetical protein